jgi:hypothetical protein
MLVTSIKMHRGRNGQTEATIDTAGFPARNEKPPPEALADPYVDVPNHGICPAGDARTKTKIT